MPAKKLISVGLALLLAMSGCGKKDDKASNLDALTELEDLNNDENAKSDDIFDEFYDDSSTTSAEDTEQNTESDFVETQDNLQSSSDSDYEPEFVKNGRYVVQISTVRSENMAEDIVRKLEDKGWPAYLAQVDNPTPDLIGTFFRIRIGGFNYLTPAKEFGEKVLVPNGYEYWIDNRSNDNIGMGGAGLGESNVDDYNSSQTTSSSNTDDWSQTNPSSETADAWGTTESTSPQTTTPAPATTSETSSGWSTTEETTPTKVSEPIETTAGTTANTTTATGSSTSSTETVSATTPEANTTQVQQTTAPATQSTQESSPATTTTQTESATTTDDDWGDNSGW